MPVILSAVAPDLQAKQWLATYKIGARTGPPVSAVSALSFAFLAYQCSYHHQPHAGEQVADVELQQRGERVPTQTRRSISRNHGRCIPLLLWH